MASGFRCLSLRVTCPSTNSLLWAKSNQNIDHTILNSRVYGGSHSFTNSKSNFAQCVVDKPKASSHILHTFANLTMFLMQALTITHTQSSQDVTNNAVNSKEHINNPQSHTTFLEQQYTLLSMHHHIQANNFVRSFRPQPCDITYYKPYFQDVPNLDHTLNLLNVDQQNLAAYYCTQLSNQEKLLLSVGPDSQQMPQQNYGGESPPSPAQLQHVFDVLSTTVSNFSNIMSVCVINLTVFNSSQSSSFNQWITLSTVPT